MINLVNMGIINTSIYQPPKIKKNIKNEKKEVKVENVTQSNKNHFDTKA